MKRLDTITGFIFAFLSLICLIFVVPRETYSLGEDFGLSPSFFPYVVFGLLLFLSGLHGIKSLCISSDEPACRLFEVRGFKKFILNCVLAFCSIMGLYFLGFLIMAPFITAAAMFIMGCRNWGLIAAVALIPAVILYAVFVVVLNLPLPKGALFL
jgi:hypothetical protein